MNRKVGRYRDGQAVPPLQYEERHILAPDSVVASLQPYVNEIQFAEKIPQGIDVMD